MSNQSNTLRQFPSAIPPDDLSRDLTIQSADKEGAVHLGIVGDTYTIVVSGEDTAGKFCLIDMYVPPGGGPPPHRHDFEETFVLLEGELEATFRGKKRVVKVGDSINIPANAPHQFHNSSSKPVRMLCVCSPAGQEQFFKEVGVPLDSRTTAPPKPSKEEEEAFLKKAMALAPTYGTELLKKA